MRTDHFATQFIKINTKDNEKGYIDLYSCDVNFLKDPESYKDVYRKLPQFRKEKVDSYKFEKDKLLSMGTWALLKSGIHKRGVSNFEDKLEFPENGKPYIKNNPLYFSLSHSGHYAMCAISSVPIGCDIEKINSDNNKTIISCCNETEIELLNDDISEFKWVGSNEDVALTRLWTLKESLVKMLGVGLSIPPKDICFTKANKKKSIYNVDYPDSDDKKIIFKEINIAPKYCSSICALLDSD